MTHRPDLVVCNPDVSSNRGKAVFFHFEIVNPPLFRAQARRTISPCPMLTRSGCSTF